MAARLLVTFQIAATSDSRALESTSLGEGIHCLWAAAFIRRDMLSPFSGTFLWKFPFILPTCLGWLINGLILPDQSQWLWMRPTEHGTTRSVSVFLLLPARMLLGVPHEHLPCSQCLHYALTFSSVGKAHPGPPWRHFSVHWPLELRQGSLLILLGSSPTLIFHSELYPCSWMASALTWGAGVSPKRLLHQI